MERGGLVRGSAVHVGPRQRGTWGVEGGGAVDSGGRNGGAETIIGCTFVAGNGLCVDTAITYHDRRVRVAAAANAKGVRAMSNAAPPSGARSGALTGAAAGVKGDTGAIHAAAIGDRRSIANSLRPARAAAGTYCPADRPAVQPAVTAKI